VRIGVRRSLLDLLLPDEWARARYRCERRLPVRWFSRFSGRDRCLYDSMAYGGRLLVQYSLFRFCLQFLAFVPIWLGAVRTVAPARAHTGAEAEAHVGSPGSRSSLTKFDSKTSRGDNMDADQAAHAAVPARFFCERMKTLKLQFR